ncbi:MULTISPECIES: restriction endonuclease subunit S [unclassified Halomonas]|uniref:restriction endonuclease subunit S n=1 Tax=unclassified Halomonas TaxID=2609666 RepID=UPI00288584A5|nr:MULTISPECIES: restriction endonuclease subunit S [unclassified Halomonas]MDT0511184.1 restriction endonuclease subunit S [Halomonas sp. LES1]MDT0590527.1 restriction endonuclease subunit S [Halomonas sp. PAR8]
MLFDPPESWRKVQLEEVCDRITVGHVGSMADKYVDDGIPFLRSQNITPFKIDLGSVKYIGEEFNSKLKKSALRPGDVAVVRTGYPGTAAVIPPSLPISNCADLVVITPSEDLDPWFLSCLFNSIWGKGAVAGNLVGVAQQHFNVSAAKNLTIYLLPLVTQRRIAAALSAYDDLIENNTRRIEILEEMARRLYEEWFVHFRFPGNEGVSFKESELGKIPEGWRIQELGDVYQINPEAIKPKSAPDEIHYIDIASVSPGQIDKAETMQFANAPGRARRIVRSGDVLWSCVRPNRRSCAMVVEPRENTVASTGFAVLRARSVSKHYLYQHVRADQFVSYLVNRATGAAYPAVKAADFKEAKIIVPQRDILSDFDKAVAPMRSLIHRLDRKNANLRAQRDLLLPKLVSGEIDVSDIPMPNDKEVEAA